MDGYAPRYPFDFRLTVKGMMEGIGKGGGQTDLGLKDDGHYHLKPSKIRITWW